MHGPQLPFCQDLHARKYRGAGESFSAAMARLAQSLSDSRAHRLALQDILLHMRFLPGGRIQSVIGSGRQATPYNCYVSGAIDDSLVDGAGAILARAREAAATMREGGGIGYDFSRLRPYGARIQRLQSAASGPLGFMPIFDAIGKSVVAAGGRRGAQMGVLRVDHPDIEAFIRAKQPAAALLPLWRMVDDLADAEQKSALLAALQSTLPLSGFNLSVALTDAFMEAVDAQRAFPLRFQGRICREVDAAALWEQILRASWDWAEPGVLFIDTINRMNNLWYCESIAATNPCGEQPLPPFGSCLLGAFNLVRYLQGAGMGRFSFDWAQLRADIPCVVRAMDKVIDCARHPLPQQQQAALATRRMGLGVTGLANAAEALGHAYGSAAFLAFEAEVLAMLRDEAYLASAALAQEKGAFPLFDREQYLAGRFIGTLREEVREAIARHGMRNSHLTSIAPCGTISLCADNVSSGIEPVFAHMQQRVVQGAGESQQLALEDYGVRVLGIAGKTSAQITPAEHVAVLITAAQYVDAAVSKTCNMPAQTRWDEFRNVYRQAWEGGAKGCTTFRVGAARMGILTSGDERCRAGRA